jgi:tetraacyldisaccharide 4'-kinase
MLNKMKIRNRIEAVMQGGTTADAGWLGGGLSVVAELYGAGVCLRKTAYAKGWLKTRRLDCLVVSVGNLTLGGTGKTPATIYLARRIQSYGYRVVVISRGYRGSAERKGGVASNGKDILMQASACGDEAYMMARALGDIPVMVGRDRYAIGRVALQKFSPQVILLDDAFQHIRLWRDLDLVLLDAGKPFGNEKLFPRGVLREEKGALHRTSAVVLTRAGSDAVAASEDVGRYAPGKPIFQCEHRPYIASTMPGNAGSSTDSPKAGEHSGLDSLWGRRGYVFSGIARNERFQRTIEQAGGQVCGTSFFDDHHWYTGEELAEIMRSAADKGAELIITTEKDFARIPHAVSWPLDLIVVGVEISFPDDAFDQYIRKELKGRTAPRAE